MTKVTTSPIIYVHYGNSRYLKWTLLSAKLSNPYRDVVLLGDEANLPICRQLAVEHVPFSRYDTDETIQEFNDVYRLVSADGVRAFWNRFVFLQWLYRKCYLEEKGIESFWTFDSDNPILESLDYAETFFSDCECTLQKRGGHA